ncbi:MAG: type I asparaginase [Kiloniellales bacterium]|nr:type I asparaginase [Kiloniellales bacterium]
MAELGSKHVCVLYTGGTLGMRPSGRGYAPARNLDDLFAAKLPELRADSMPSYTLIEYDPPLESSNATPEHWYALAEKIRDLASDYDGFVVIHGTDTLAYSASALSFLLAGLAKPVVLTGSQIPLCELRNDAHGNLLTAIQVVALNRTSEVTVCFGRRLFRGNRVIKVRANALDAFDSPNYPPLADVGTEIRFRNGQDNDWPPVPEVLGRPRYRACQVALMPVFPGFSPSLVHALLDAGVQGLVLECYGVGNAPDQDPALLAALGRARDAGVPVIAVTQCLEGSVSLGTYAAGQSLADCGVISGFDMTPEASLTKLHVLLSQGLAGEPLKQALQANLRGELTPKGV